MKNKTKFTITRQPWNLLKAFCKPSSLSDPVHKHCSARCFRRRCHVFKSLHMMQCSYDQMFRIVNSCCANICIFIFRLSGFILRLDAMFLAGICAETTARGWIFAANGSNVRMRSFHCKFSQGVFVQSSYSWPWNLIEVLCSSVFSCFAYVLLMILGGKPVMLGLPGWPPTPIREL